MRTAIFAVCLFMITTLASPIQADFADEAADAAEETSPDCSYSDRNTDHVSCRFLCGGVGTVSVNAGVNDNVSFTASAACSDGTASCGGSRDTHDCPQTAKVSKTSDGVCSFHAEEIWDSGGYVTCSWNSKAEGGDNAECVWLLDETKLICQWDDDGRYCVFAAGQNIICTGPNEPETASKISMIVAYLDPEIGKPEGMHCDRKYCEHVEFVKDAL